MLSRLSLLVGPEALERLASTRFLVCGLGGVGSWAAEALARSGAGKMLLADCDTVSESNINRQALAFHSTLGKMKCQVALERLKDISPAAEIIALPERLTQENIPALLDIQKPDGVLDAIDDRQAKLALLTECHRRHIPIVSSMGAANKTHPELVRLADISETSGCPFCHLIRKALRRQGIDSGIQCVYSPEAPVETPETVSEEPGHKRPMGSLITVTAVFGLLAAQALMEPYLQLSQLSHRGGWKP